MVCPKSKEKIYLEGIFCYLGPTKRFGPKKRDPIGIEPHKEGSRPLLTAVAKAAA
jgi:hypothetical protein